MGIVRKKKKELKKHGAAMGAGVHTATERPSFKEKMPPCIYTCPNNNQIRKWLMTIAKAEDYDKSYDQAFEEAFYVALETTPFPSICGRVCPHPCETGCNRTEKETSG